MNTESITQDNLIECLDKSRKKLKFIFAEIKKKCDNKKTQPNKSQQHKNYYHGRSCIFRTSRANKPLRFDQQKPLVTDQQN